MPACAFFSNAKKEKITNEMYDILYEIFKRFIVKKGVKIFYTASISEFDSVCESVIVKLKELYTDVVMIKIARNDDRTKINETSYDHIFKFENNNNVKRCRYIFQLADYILLDTVYSSNSSDLLFLQLFGANYSRLNEVEFYVLDEIIKDMKK